MFAVMAVMFGCQSGGGGGKLSEEGKRFVGSWKSTGCYVAFNADATVDFYMGYSRLYVRDGDRDIEVAAMDFEEVKKMADIGDLKKRVQEEKDAVQSNNEWSLYLDNEVYIGIGEKLVKVDDVKNIKDIKATTAIKESSKFTVSGSKVSFDNYYLYDSFHEKFSEAGARTAGYKFENDGGTLVVDFGEGNEVSLRKM
jgi:hypothetical protein